MSKVLELVAYGKKFGELEDEPFFKPGIKVWFEGNSEPKLVGDINLTGSPCSCCNANNDTVEFYAL